MQIWPAIDLRDGKCVRLQQGDYEQQTVFSENPVEVAQRWQADGAQYLHLVDLDGARAGTLTNRNVIERIVSSVEMVCEVGGGIRDEATMEQLIEAGVARLVIGTKAITHPEWFTSMCQAYPGRLVLGIDAKSGKVATEGWEQESNQEPISVARRYRELPIAAIIYTDIATDGMLAGPNLNAMQEMQAAVNVPVIASGGVTTREDVAALAAIPMAGAIIGRALYEHKISIGEALDAVRSVAG
jgi:phosphoribosylformimino-5-aminoimidazole carboxamide ribotide isomerase